MASSPKRVLLAEISDSTLDRDIVRGWLYQYKRVIIKRDRRHKRNIKVRYYGIPKTREGDQVLHTEIFL